MSFLTTIVEYEGVVANVRARYWAAHSEAVKAMGFRGPTADEFWRLLKTGASDGLMVPYAKTPKVLEYRKLRDERLNAADLIALDEVWPEAGPNLKIFKNMGTCHLVSLCFNREALNAALDRMDVWMHFDKKQMLPADGDRRVAVLREMMGGIRTLAIAGSVPFAYAAGEAGCRVIGMKTGLAFPKQFQQVGVDLCFESLDALTEAMARHDPALQKLGVMA